MRPIATDGVAWSVCVSVCLSVCLSVTFVSPAKTAEPIEIRVGGLTRMGPRNRILHVLNVSLLRHRVLVAVMVVVNVR